MHVVRIGEVARAALARSAGVAVPLSGFADSPYLDAAGEIIWVGARIPVLHPRAVVTEAAPPRGVTLHFESLPDEGWAPHLPFLDEESARRVIAGAQRLCKVLVGADTPRGFGVLLAGRTPVFPLDFAVPRVTTLADAYRRDACKAVFAASVALLGFGTGLTPCGDDLAGAALFGRQLIAPDNTCWTEIAERLSREVSARSHAVSAALFGDLARGQSFAPLHATVEALAGGDDAGAHAAARSLAEIGHSSGWDMLTGLIIGITGTFC